MCELLGMECNVPTDIVFSFTALSMRGGRTAHHSDGWGLALYEGNAARVFLEPTAASLLDDMVLDAHRHDDHVHFSLEPQQGEADEDS